LVAFGRFWSLFPCSSPEHLQLFFSKNIIIFSQLVGKSIQIYSKK
jgi:hypothetical protein